MNRLLWIYGKWIVFLLASSPVILFAQLESFKIDTILSNPDDGTIDFHVRAIDEKGQKLNLNGLNTRVYEITPSQELKETEIFLVDRNTDPLRTIVKISTGQRVSMGEKREYLINWNDGEKRAQKAYKSPGTPNYPNGLYRLGINDWMNLIVVGLLSVTLLYVTLGQLYPLYKQLVFKKKFVRPYFEVKEEGRTRYDPITGEPFNNSEKVVIKCQRMTSWESWKYNGHQCPDYPKCMHASDPCREGRREYAYDNFFEQQGEYRLFNWLWFGSVGGFSAWLVWASVRLILPQNIYTANEPGIPFDWFYEMFLGAALGIGLTLFLAFVEEKGLFRALSWNRIVIRGLLGTLGGIIAFALGLEISQFIPEMNLELDLYLKGLPSYALLGIFIGAVLAYKSSIKLSRSLTGGVVAAVMGYSLYFMIVQLFQSPEWGRMLGFVVLGTILGIMIVSVVYQKSDYILEIISPPKFNRTLSLNKWLDGGENVMIGSDPSCQIYIKWQDPSVNYRHALLKLLKGAVVLIAQEELYLNERMVRKNQEVRLKKGDIIRLGRGGATQLRFYEEKQNYFVGEEPHESKSSPANRVELSPYTYLTRESKSSKIVIRRRNNF